MSTLREIEKKVKSLLLHNTKEGYSKFLQRSFCYIMPSPEKYPFQWWLDTFLHIIMLCQLKEIELAKRNLRSLFTMQEEDGFVGHMIYWQRLFPKTIWNIIQARPTLRQFRPHMSSIIQPPFAAQALEQIYNCSKDQDFLIEMYPKIKKYHRWLRQRLRDNLLIVVSPNETAFDWKPSFDSLVHFQGKANYQLYWKIVKNDFINFWHGYSSPDNSQIQVQEVACNTIYVRELESLNRIAKFVKDPSAENYKKQARHVTKAISNRLYNPQQKAFLDRDYLTKKHLTTFTPTIFYPLALEIPKKMRKELTDNLAEFFSVPYPMPSVSPADSSFDPHESRYIWRGPTWIFHNWFLYHCFKEQNLSRYATQLKKSSLECLQKSGFREYYNPFTGEGYGAVNFTWSGLVIDMD